nr:hypothetical protein [candidate division Zixibacteria bacterium]
MFKKTINILAVILLLAIFVLPFTGHSGPPPDTILNASWMCSQCISGDSWWCAGCLGMSQQEYRAYVFDY